MIKGIHDLGAYREHFIRGLKRGEILARPSADSPTEQMWHDNIVKLSFLQKWLKSPLTEEIILHTPQSLQVASSTSAHLESYPLELSAEEDLMVICEVLGLHHGIDWNYTHPFASFTCTSYGKNHLRVTLLHPAITPSSYPKLFLRLIRDTTYRFADFKLQNFDELFLRRLVNDKKNVLVAGPTGSGKTSLLKTLLSTVPIAEHLVILEDANELHLSRPHCTHLLGKADELKNFCSYALRLRPDRIILGEMRGEEIVPYILAMNTGHRGLMSTVHANSAKDALERLCLLFALYNRNGEVQYQTIKRLICAHLDYVIYIENKKVKEIAPLQGEGVDAETGGIEETGGEGDTRLTLAS